MAVTRMSDAAAWEKTLANFFRTVGVHSEGTYAAYAASNLAGPPPLFAGARLHCSGGADGLSGARRRGPAPMGRGAVGAERALPRGEMGH